MRTFPPTIRPRRRAPRGTWLVALLLACAGAPLPSVAHAQTAATAADTKRRLADGDKAARAKQWGAALDAYKAAYDASPSAPALLGLANAQYQLKQVAAAHDSYTELLKTFGAKLARADKWEAETRLKQLASQTGSLEVRVSEPGAIVQVDGATIGTSPIASPARVASGRHTIRVTKAGFLPFETAPDVPPNGATIVEAALVHESNKAHLGVRERSGAEVRVVLDDIDVGAAPWEGDVEAGKHTVMVRSSVAASPTQSVELSRGQKQDLELVAVRAQAHVEIKTSDGKGNIYVDGKIVGEGSYAGDVPVGPHVVAVSREGFARAEKTVTLSDKQVYAETVTLRREGGDVATATEERSSDPAEHSLEGFYGGLGLTGFYGIGGQGTELETHCSSLGATSCDTPAPMGGGLYGYFGYFLNPVGFELMLGGLFDSTSQKANFNGDTSRGENPLVASPARTETFRFLRGGGIAAVRARFMTSGRVVRLSVAAGFGVSYKAIGVKRDVSATDGLSDTYVPDTKTYFSPAVTADAAVLFQLSPSFALSVGVLAWGENAQGDLTVAPDPNRHLVSASQAVPIATPAYHLATSTQIFIGPTLGVQFGP